MGHSVLRKIIGYTHKSPFLAIMADETADVSNKEQLAIIIRWVSDSFDVFEEFLGMYSLNTTDADSIVSAITDVLLRFQISITKIRGQCYNGCNTMAGLKGGVAVKIQQKEPQSCIHPLLWACIKFKCE